MFKGVWHVFCGWNLNFVAKIDEIPLNVGCKIAVPRFGCKEPYHVVCLKWLSSILYFNHITDWILRFNVFYEAVIGYMLPVFSSCCVEMSCFHFHILTKSLGDDFRYKSYQTIFFLECNNEELFDENELYSFRIWFDDLVSYKAEMDFAWFLEFLLVVMFWSPQLDEEFCEV